MSFDHHIISYWNRRDSAKIILEYLNIEVDTGKEEYIFHYFITPYKGEKDNEKFIRNQLEFQHALVIRDSKERLHFLMAVIPAF